MDCIELSIKRLEDECCEWSEKIKKEYQPDMIVYVAKAGFLIARVMSEVFSVPLTGISAVRKGNNFKSKLAVLFRKIPNKIRYKLIELELKSNIHKMNSERCIFFINDISTIDADSIKKIIVVDDSVDTGYTIKAVIKAVKQHFVNAEVKVASLNVWGKSEEVIKTDFALYRNTIIKSPMSKDSSEYNDFLNLYYSKLQ